MNSMKPLCLAFAAELAELAQPQFSNRTNVSKKELFTSKALGLGGERTHKENNGKAGIRCSLQEATAEVKQ